MAAGRFIGIIPARYASTRFPGKPLALIGGKPMVQVVYERVSQAGLHQCVVATDDERIFQAVIGFGGQAVMTRTDQASGTDRCGEAAQLLHLNAHDVVINIQGDEPSISRNEIQLLTGLFQREEVCIATLLKPFTDRETANNPNLVKAVRDKDGKALYFSRLPIPYPRDPQTATPLYHQHIGIYAYRYNTLCDLVTLKPSMLEQNEKLEQLRWLENGYSIHTAICQYEGIGIDTPDDLERLGAQITNLGK